MGFFDFLKPKKYDSKSDKILSDITKNDEGFEKAYIEGGRKGLSEYMEKVNFTKRFIDQHKEPSEQYYDKAYKEFYFNQDYNSAIRTADIGLKIVKNYSYKSMLLQIKAKSYNQLRRFQDALNVINESLNNIYSNDNNDFILLSDAHTLRSKIYGNIGNQKQAELDLTISNAYKEKEKNI